MPPLADIYNKQYLMAAGPTPIPPRVSQVMAEPITYHRAPAFVATYARVLENLKAVFQTSNDILCFASSGSGGMESAVANLLGPGDPAIVVSCGKFGERWIELCQAYGAEVIAIEYEWGERADPAEIDNVLAEVGGPPKAVFVTHSETSTGVVNDIKTINEVVLKHNSITVVDAVSAIGAIDLPQDEWGVDVVVAGSQKALMCPPGLGFASVSERALRMAEGQEGRRYYFDWSRTAKGQRQSPPNSAFTPAVTIFNALDVALSLILEEGLEQVFARHAILARAARAGIAGLGLSRFGADDPNANTVTVAELPDSIDGTAVPKLMRDRYGVTIAGGQSHLKGKIARLAHCGYYGAFDITVQLTALELALRDLGWEVSPAGSGAGAAQRVFAECGAPQPA